MFASERCKNVAETAEEARKMIDEVEIDAAEEEEEVILQKNIVVETVKEETSEQGSGKNGFAAATREEQKASCSTDQFILHFQGEKEEMATETVDKISIQCKKNIE